MTRRSSADAVGGPTSGRTVETVVTFLEMAAPPARTPLWPPAGAEVRRAFAPSVAFYRYLYDAVGRDWTWTERTLLSDDQLAAIIQHPEVEVHVLWRDGVPGGYAELDLRERDAVELTYFGLVPECIGQGLGRYLLDWAVHRAWRAGPTRVWVHTCDLDHPRALTLYQNAGFAIYRRQRYRHPLPAGPATPARGAGTRS